MKTAQPANKILIIDDDALLRRSLRGFLEKEEFTVLEAADGKSGLYEFNQSLPSLVILDILMPNLNGLEVCQRLRIFSEIPIIVLTNLNSEDDIIEIYESGATYYMSKPCMNSLLMARIRAALNLDTYPKPTSREQYNDGYLTIDLARREVYVQGQPIFLSGTEYSLLAYLVQNAGRTLTFRQILNHVWHQNAELKSARVHTVIWRLRNKLEEDPKHPRYMVAEYGIGYRIDIPQQSKGKISLPSYIRPQSNST